MGASNATIAVEREALDTAAVAVTVHECLRRAQTSVAIHPCYAWTPLVEARTTSVFGEAEAKQKIRELHPFQCLAEPRDVANAALFLASDEARLITLKPQLNERKLAARRGAPNSGMTEVEIIKGIANLIVSTHPMGDEDCLRNLAILGTVMLFQHIKLRFLGSPVPI